MRFVNPGGCIVKALKNPGTFTVSMRSTWNVFDCLFSNLRGYERAITTSLHITGGLQMSASNTFSIHNTNKNNQETLHEQRRQLEFFRDRGIPVDSAIVMTAFGCNFEGAIAPETVRDCVGKLLDLAD